VEDISWDQAYTEIAQRVKKTRDDTFVETDAQAAPSIAAKAWPSPADAPTQRVQLSRRKSMRSWGLLPGNQARV